MDSLKRNSAASFVAVAIVYVLAGIVGLLVYRAVGLEWWFSLLIADAAATVFTFVFSLIFAVSIPMADKRQSRKVGFEEYKKQTRMLLPIKK